MLMEGLIGWFGPAHNTYRLICAIFQSQGVKPHQLPSFKELYPGYAPFLGGGDSVEENEAEFQRQLAAMATNKE